jgi:hypothetical protein
VRLDKIRCIEIRRADMISDEMSAHEMRKEKALKRDVKVVCEYSIGTCLVQLFML